VLNELGLAQWTDFAHHMLRWYTELLRHKARSALIISSHHVHLQAPGTQRQYSTSSLRLDTVRDANDTSEISIHGNGDT